MIVTLTKTFQFSASFAEGNKVLGRNYTLRVTFRAPDGRLEEELAEKVERSLIQKLHSRDLGEDVDFLKGTELNDPVLLKKFWAVLEPAVRPAVLSSLSLERDRRTEWKLATSD